jgi:hypothetical protein
VRPINILLLDEPAAIDMHMVAKAIRERYPDVPTDVIDGEPSGPGSKDSPLIRCNGEFVVIMNNPTALERKPETDAIWQRASIAWPPAIEARDRHRAHLIVATLTEGKAPLAEARTLTAVIGGLLDCLPQCSAVMWGPRVARSAADWKTLSRAAFAAYPECPVLLWIDILPAQTPAGIEVFTAGLSSFIGREIECEAGDIPLPTVMSNVGGLTGYLVEHGDVVQDGNTFGDDDANMTIRHAMSPHRPDLPVLRITPTRSAPATDE